MNSNTILVVDADKDLRELFRDVLTSKGYEVLVSTCAEDAVKIAKRHGVFAAFVDIRMPDIDGIQLLKDIKAVRAEAHVIVMTGCTRDECVGEALRLGCFVCMMKPLKPRDIAGVLDVLEAGFETPTDLAA